MLKFMYIVSIIAAVCCGLCVVLDIILLFNGRTPFFGSASPVIFAGLCVFNVVVAYHYHKVLKS